MEPARGESCLSGQRRGPATPGEDKLPSPGQKSFHISTTPTTRGRKRRSPGSMTPRKVWKPQPTWLVANWLGLRPTTEPRCSKVIFPNYSKKKRAEDALVPTLWGTRETNVCFSRIICSRCCTRRNLGFHVENCQHADEKQLARR